jgi:hypothetical protein
MKISYAVQCERVNHFSPYYFWTWVQATSETAAREHCEAQGWRVVTVKG